MPRHTKTLMGAVLDLNIKVAASGDATIVVCELEDAEGLVALSSSGTAKRGPDDRNLPVVGENLALARALEGMAHKLRKEVRRFL